MKALALVCVVPLLGLSGCQKAEAPAAVSTPSPVATTPPPAPNNGNTVRQYTPTNLGGITPVQGGESLEGGGSAAGNVLKDRARHLPGATDGPPPTAPGEGTDAATGQ